MKRTRNPASVHPPVAACSHQIELRGEQRMPLFSGPLGMTPDGEVSEDPAQQLAVAGLTAPRFKVEIDAWANSGDGHRN